MNCRQINRLLYDYCDNILNPDKRSQFEQHVADCHACRKNVDEALLESSILREPCLIPDLPPDFTTRIMDKVAALPAATTKSTAPTERIMSAKWSRYLINCVGLVAILLLVFNLPGILKSQNLWPLADREQLATKTNMDIKSGSGSTNTATISMERSSELDKELSLSDSEINYHTKENTDAASDTPAIAGAPEPAVTAPEITEAPEAAAVAPDISATSNPSNSLNKPYKTHSPQGANTEVQMMAATPDESSLAATSFPLQPSNLPSSYALLDKVDSHASATYTYTDDRQGKQLTINIAQLPLRVLGSPGGTSYSRGYMREEATPTDAAATNLPAGDEFNALQETEEAKVEAPSTATTNTISYEIEFNSQKYLLTVSSNITREELETLVRSLEFTVNTPD